MRDTVSNTVIADIRSERKRQKTLALGEDTDAFDRSNSQNDWVAHITAYVGRAASKVHRNQRETCLFRSHMVKVAALAMAAIESYDKGYCPDQKV